MSGALKVVIVVVVVVGIAVGAWLAAPLFYESRVDEELPEDLKGLDAAAPPVTVTEGMPGVDAPPAPDGETTTTVEQAGPTVLKTGTFEGVDRFHKGSGMARVLEIDGKRYMRFEDDFSVTNGPDLFIYFGRDGKYDPETKLGRLKGSAGSQNYAIPESINVEDYNEVWVWCRAFSVPFSKAGLS